MKTAHTPGPWRQSSNQSRDEYASVVLGPNGQIITRTQTDVYTDPETAEANAALIARAPELLEECQQYHEANEALIAQITAQAADVKKFSAEWVEIKAINAELLQALKALECDTREHGYIPPSQYDAAKLIERIEGKEAGHA